MALYNIWQITTRYVRALNGDKSGLQNIPINFPPEPVYTNPAAIATAGNVTLTGAQVRSGIITRDCNGGARSDNTPTAALIVAAVAGAAVGQTFDLIIHNISAAANTLTLVAGTGVTIKGTATIAQSNVRCFQVRLDNVTAGAEAVTFWNLGSSAA